MKMATMRSTFFFISLCYLANALTAISSEGEFEGPRISGLRKQRHLSSKSATSVTGSSNSKSSKSTKSPVGPKASKSSKSSSLTRSGKSDSIDNARAIDEIHGADDAVTNDGSAANPTVTEDSRASQDATTDSSTKTETNDVENSVEGTTDTTESTLSPTSASQADINGTTSSPTVSPSDAAAVRTVQLLHPDASDECLAYDASIPQASVRMIKCTPTTTDGTHMDHWEVMDESSGLFYLRHKHSQLCIPMNPEFPDQPFDCFRYSGESEAVADSLNGLVDCNSGFAAIIGLDDATGALYLYNEDCLTNIEPGLETDVILMSYRRGHAENGIQIAMWGERILMEMHHLVVQHNFQANWTFVEV
jgi:hypothetical protein